VTAPALPRATPNGGPHHDSSDSPERVPSPEEPAAAGGRTTGGYARACVLSGVATLAVALTVDPLVEGLSWLAPTVVAVLTVTIIGVLAAYVRLPAAGAAALAAFGGFVVCTALFVPYAAALGGFLPTPSSTVALVDLLRLGLDTANTVAVPAPATPDIQALVTVATTAVAVIVQVIAAWARHPGVAGLPLFMTAFVPAALAPEGIGVQAFIVAGLGFLALTLSDADERIRRWGPILRRRSTARGSQADPIVGSFVRPAVITATVALAIAVVVPTLIPGVGRSNLNDVVQETFGEGGTRTVNTLNPFLFLARDLTQPDDVEVLTYATEQQTPDPLRIVTNDVIDSQQWAPSTPAIPIDRTVDGPLPRPPGASDAVLAAAAQVRTEIRITGLQQQYLPLPYPAVSIDIDGQWLYDAETLNVISGEDSTLNKTYLVTSYEIVPDAAMLRAAPAPPAILAERYTVLPEDSPEIIATTAAQVTTGAATAYDQAMALQQYFRSDGGFSYSLDVNNDGRVNAMESFLTEKQGYCAQFSSAMALMARSLGIPARVAVGFLPGEPLDGGAYSVSIRDAHAWPELYFEGVGWVRFEPTPAARTGSPPAWAAPEVAEPSAAPSAGGPLSGAAPTRPLAVEPSAAAAAPRSGADDRFALTVGLVALTMLALLVLGLGPRAWRWAREQWRWRAAGGDPHRIAEAAWLTLSERVADLGWRWGTGTLREEAGALVAAAELYPSARDALWRVVEAGERARFAASPAPSDGLRADAAAVVTAVASQQPRSVRLRAVWLPSLGPQSRAGSGEHGFAARVGTRAR